MGKFKTSSVQGPLVPLFLSDLWPVLTPEMLKEEEREAVDGQRACCSKALPHPEKVSQTSAHLAFEGFLYS